MKIAFLLGSVERSGGVRVTVSIANQLAQAGHNCMLVISSDEAIPFPVFSTIEIIRARQFFFFRKLNRISKWVSLVVAVPSGTQVLVASYYLTTYVAFIAKIFHPFLKLVYIIQGFEPNYFRQPNGNVNRFSYWLARFSYKLPFSRTTISHWLAATLHHSGINDVPVINNGIDTDLFCPGNSLEDCDDNIILTVGHNRPNRGYFDFCKAVNLLWLKRKDFKVIVMGGDPELGNLLDPVHEYRAITSDDDLVALYRSASIYVTCSQEEGFGLTPLEAMACGTSVVCTDSGGVRDFAINEVNCLMVPPGDIALIANALGRLLESAPLRQTLVFEGVRTAPRFDWKVIGQKYVTMFEQLEL